MTDQFVHWGMAYDWAWFLATIIGILIIALPLMLAVAMIIYAERKIWAAMALRRGPNVVGPWGLLQLQPLDQLFRAAVHGGARPADGVGQEEIADWIADRTFRLRG